jgi:hypothetical protein
VLTPSGLELKPTVGKKISELMNKTQESVSKSQTFTSAEGCATNKSLVKQAHAVGSPFRFLSLTQHWPLLLLIGVRVHSLSQLTTDEVKGKVSI